MTINRNIDHKGLWINSMIGMSMGFFSTLILGTIMSIIGIYSKDNIFLDIKNILGFISPFAIGIGIGFKAKLSPLQILSLAITAFIASKSLLIPHFLNGNIVMDDIKINLDTNIKHIGDVLTSWIAGVLVIYCFSIFKWESNWDFILLPIIGIALGLFDAFWLTYLISLITVSLEYVIYEASSVGSGLMIVLAPIIGGLMGLALSFPISSAAIAIALKLSGDAAIAAMVGTAAQMLSFGIMTYWSTKSFAKTIAVGFGTSMLQMDNFTRKPILLLIPTLTSAICSLIAVAVFKGELLFDSEFQTSGMGTAILYGPIFTMQIHSWTNINAWMLVLFLELLAPIIISAILLICFNKIKVLKLEKGWLNIWNNTQQNTLQKQAK